MRVPFSDTQERLEGSDLGRVLISAFLVLTLVAIVTLNLPWQYQTELKRQLSRVATPYSKATGVEQNWSVFAPTPRDSTLRFSARIRFADGSHADWRPDFGDPYIGEFSGEHWVKWQEAAVRPDFLAIVARPSAIWLARRFATDGRRPVEVSFTRTFRYTPQLASNARPKIRVEHYFHLRITRQMLAGAV
jgi:hypothetical protein